MATDPALRIAEEFQVLQARSQDLFSGLRDLASHTPPKAWRPYFQRAFAVFTKLWKFQQLHRLTLEKEESYGLKRHEVGEIASRIGQLYYHLRTSDTSFLVEAYTFYEAIWDRNYFQDVMATRITHVASKRLRYCSRFMIVALLAGRWDRAQALAIEMKRFVDEFADMLDPTDKEDMFRILQLLEREPVRGATTNDDDATDCPPKYLLHLPAASNILAHLALSVKELSPTDYMFFYFSGPGRLASGASTSMDLLHLGVDTKEIVASADSGTNGTAAGNEHLHEHRLHLSDVLSFLRRPFFGVIDCPAAHAFRKIPKLYQASFMFLCSPQEYPEREREWDLARAAATEWEQDILTALVKHDDTPAFLLSILGDDFLSRFVVRFVVCRVVLTHHVHFIKTTELPCCHPDLSDTQWTDLEVISRERFGRIAGHVFTIEPMINEGTHADDHWPDQWTAVTRDGKRSAQFEHTLLITETGVEVLTLRDGHDVVMDGLAPPEHLKAAAS
ncbi:hypothetical protein H9P43_000078 [Blastocladiella emersonii ATCC 22665]|nr:hypothetical protein H9P43_000078 [Blastocladiella emersonii ATCC 22665]